MGQQPMPACMPRQKINLPAAKFAADDRIGRSAERRLYLTFSRILKTVDLVKTASADDANSCSF